LVREDLSQRREIGFVGFRAGMKIDFAQSLRQPLEQAFKPVRGHGARSGQTEDLVRRANAETPQWTRGGSAEGAKDERDGGEVFRLAHEPQHLESACGERSEQSAQDEGMEMQVRVTVGVSAAKTERAKTRKLFGDLVAERFGGARVEGITQPGERGRLRKMSVLIRDRRAARRAARAEREMQAETQPRMAPRDAHRFVHGAFIDHEAGLGEQTGFVMALDGFVDRGAAAEVVAGEEEMFQGARTISPRAGTRRKA